MLLELLVLILLISSATVLLVIILRKFSLLATIDVDAVPQEKVEQKKEDIIEMRLKRKWEWLKNKISLVFSPVLKGLGNIFKSIYNKALELEKYYQEKAQPVSDKATLNQQKVRALISEGEELIKSEEYAEAEKRFIQVISLDHMNIAAYDNLGKVYLGQKDYEHAIEALQHALKLNDQDSSVYHDLGLVYKEIEDLEKSVLYLKKAVKLDPNNPKHLDALIEISILDKDKFLAHETFRKLKKVNPENQKLSEIEKQINEIKI